MERFQSKKTKISSLSKVLFFSIFTLILLFQSSFSLAEEITGNYDSCCIFEDTCEPAYVGTASNTFVEYTQSTCINAEGERYEPLSSCTALASPGGDCEFGCCCLFTEDVVYNTGNDDSLRVGCDEPKKFIGVTDGVQGDPINCDTVCTTEFVTISGKVFNLDGVTLSPAIITFTSADGKEFSTNTNNGDYQLSVLANKIYSIRVTDPLFTQACLVSETGFSVGSAAITNKNFNLACAPTTGDCIFRYEYVFGENPDGLNCGKITAVNVLNPCPGKEVGVDTLAVGVVVECPPNGGNLLCVHDGTVMDPEECDPLKVFTPDEADCTKLSGNKNYIGGNIFCTGDCKISEENCLTCPTNEADCTGSLCGVGCAKCDASPVCFEEPVCDAGAEFDIKLTALDPSTQGGIGFKIEPVWTPEAGKQRCEVDNYEIIGCRGNAQGTECATSITENIASNLGDNWVSYDHIINAAETLYKKYFCYEVTADMKDGSDPNIIKACKLVGGGECIGKAAGDQFCGFDTSEYVGVCGVEGVELPIDEANNRCEEKTCIETSAVTAKCVSAETICEYCSGPFNMFSYIDKKLRPADSAIILAGTEWSSTFVSPQDARCVDVEQVYGICYYDDFSDMFTPIGQYKACSEIKSCYDYKTQKSCTDSYCNNPLASDCTWQEFSEGNELGIGVCRPTDPLLQDCTKCNDASPLGNCPKELCSLYGAELVTDSGIQRCYFDEEKRTEFNIDSGEGTCINSEDVACENYDSKDDCLRGTAQSEQAVSVSLGNGKNTVTASNDLLKKGRCYWDANYEGPGDSVGACFKDADNDKTLPSDCTTADSACLTDMKAPETTIMSLEENGIYSRTQIENIKFQATDNSYSGENIITFFSLVAKLHSSVSGYSYPQLTLPQLKTEVSKIKDRETGPYTLNYFSKDRSKNLEVVKSLNFLLIQSLHPSVKLNITNVYLGVNGGPDAYEINLTANVTYTPAYQNGYEVFCTPKFINEKTPTIQLVDEGKKQGPSDLVWRYNYLEDGFYTLEIVCEDNHDQTFTYLKEHININSNPAISSPFPTGEAFRKGDVPISIETEKESNCWYQVIEEEPANALTQNNAMKGRNSIARTASNKMKTLNQNDWVEYETDEDGLFHTAIYDAQQEGITIIVSKCEYDVLDNDGALVETREVLGTSADTIFFAIDETAPPRVELFDLVSNVKYDVSSDRVDSLNLRFVCNDEPIYYENNELTDYSFGCESLLICEYDSETSDCNDFKIPTLESESTDERQKSWTYVLGSPATKRYKYVDYQINDSGNNSEVYTVFLPNLRDITFDNPSVTICDPLASLPCDAQ